MRQITPNPRETRVIVRLPHGFAQTVEQVVAAPRRATAGNFVSFAVPGVTHERAMETIAIQLKTSGGLSERDFNMEIDQIQMPSSPIVLTADGYFEIGNWLGGLVKLFRRRRTPATPATPGTVAPVNEKCYHIARVGFDRAWNAGVRGKNVIIGVNDTGCGPAQHVPCQSNLNTVGFDDPQYETDNDHHGHGTHVAGIACAALTCDQGIYGGAPDATLKVFKSGVGYFYTSDLMQAIDAAMQAGVHVLNNSWGGAPSAFMQELITTAYNRGMLIIKAVGNESKECPDPYHDCIMVSAIDEYDYPSYYTNWVSNAYVANTIATYGDNILSHLPQEKTGFMSGTSMATPVVTAAAALVAEKYAYPPAKQLMCKLLQSCIEPISQSRYGCGKLSLLKEFNRG